MRRAVRDSSAVLVAEARELLAEVPAVRTTYRLMPTTTLGLVTCHSLIDPRVSRCPMPEQETSSLIRLPRGHSCGKDISSASRVLIPRM